MKKFCRSLSEHAKNIINFEKLCEYFEKVEMLSLPKEELKSYQDAKVCYIYGKRIL